jgi:outer membrane protein OmpA-like peptidoglycan-associated protein/tetratricopeptide (TPR) repeat protein
MRSLLKNLFLLLLLVQLTGGLPAGAQALHTQSGKAVKYFNDARELYFLMKYKEASEAIEKAIAIDPSFLEAQLLKAEIYSDMKDREKAIEAYKAVLRTDSTFFPNAMYNLGRLEFRLGKYEEALHHLEAFLRYANNNPRVVKKANRDIRNCRFALEGIQHPVPFEPVNLGPSINSPLDEYWPSLTADEQTIVFTVLVPGRYLRMRDFEQQDYQEDFYISHQTDTGWALRKPLGAPINSRQNEGAQTLSADGRMMFFTACNRPDGMGRCDIYSSHRLHTGWSNPANVGPPVDSRSWEAQPSISADGNTLWFVSNRSGGYGGMDIWYSRYKDGKWQTPVNAGNKINTPGNEMSPFIHNDNQTLYFSSDGHPGYGGFDLYISRRQPDSSWSEAKNLGYPINTYNDEIGLFVNAGGNTGYYSTDREEGKGKDIYSFELYDGIRPHFVTYMKGKVYDAVTKRPLTAHIVLIDLQKNESVMDATSGKDGTFLVCIPTNRDYALNVSKDGYLFYSDHFPLKGVHRIEKPYIKDVPLKPIRVGEVMVLKNIFFEFDSYELRPESISELEYLRDLLVKNPGLRIEIGGHTDSKGSNQYNQELSRQRARVVYQYLVQHGIDKNRLTYKGYGETQPVSSNETEEGRAANRRTEIKIVGI